MINRRSAVSGSILQYAAISAGVLAPFDKALNRPHSSAAARAWLCLNEKASSFSRSEFLPTVGSFGISVMPRSFQLSAGFHQAAVPVQDFVSCSRSPEKPICRRAWPLPSSVWSDMLRGL